MLGWMLQRYWYVPGVVKVMAALSVPEAMSPVSNDAGPDTLVAVCVRPVLLCQITVEPCGTVRDWGVKAPGGVVFSMVMTTVCGAVVAVAVGSGGGLVGVGGTGVLVETAGKGVGVTAEESPGSTAGVGPRVTMT